MLLWKKLSSEYPRFLSRILIKLQPDFDGRIKKILVEIVSEAEEKEREESWIYF